MDRPNQDMELDTATQLRKTYLAKRARLIRMILLKKSELRKHKEWKALGAMKADLKTAEAGAERAAATVFGILEERATGQTRLPLFDAAQNGSSNGDVHTAADQQPRGPVRRSAARAAGKDAAP